MFDVDHFERHMKRETKRVVKQMRMLNELERLIFDYANKTLTEFGKSMHRMLTDAGHPRWVPKYLSLSQTKCIARKHDSRTLILVEELNAFLKNLPTSK